MTKRWTKQDVAYLNAQRKLMSRLAAVRQPPIEPTIGRSYTFIIAGEAEPGGSKKAFVPLQKDKVCTCGPTPVKLPFYRAGGGVMVNVVDANSNAEHWKIHVGRVARSEYSGPTFAGALEVTFHFYRARPQSHYNSTGGLSKEGREHPFPITRPDLLKLARSTEDALTGIVWTDDSIIVREHLLEDWGVPRVEITIGELIVPEPFEQPALFQNLNDLPAPWETGASAANHQPPTPGNPARENGAATRPETSGAGTARSDHNRTRASEDRPPWEQEDRTEDRQETKQTSRRK